MKKILVGVIAVIMVASLSACSNEEAVEVKNVKETLKEVDKETEAETEDKTKTADETKTEEESAEVDDDISSIAQIIEKYEKIRTIQLTGMNGEPLTVTEYEMDEEDISSYAGTFLSHNNREIRFYFEGPSDLTEVGEVNEGEFCIRNEADSRAFVFYIGDLLEEGELIDTEAIAKRMEEYQGMTNDELREAMGVMGFPDITVDEDSVEWFYENNATMDNPYCGYTVSKIKMFEAIAIGGTYLEYTPSYNDDNVLRIFDTMIIE